MDSKQPLKLSVNPIKPQLVMNSGRGVTASPTPFSRVDPVGASTTRVLISDGK